MALRFRSASTSVVRSSNPSTQQPGLNESQSEPAVSLRRDLSKRLGTAAFHRIYPPESRLVLSSLSQYEKEVYALILRHDPAKYRTPREFFSRTASMIAYLPAPLRNPLPFGIPQDKVVNVAHKLGASKETLHRTSFLCALHLQLNGLVTMSARNMVETHAEDFLYDIKKLIRKRNMHKLSDETKTYMTAAEDILAMTLPLQEWRHFYDRDCPTTSDWVGTACDACFMMRVSGCPDALIALRGIALTCVKHGMVDDLGNERSKVAVDWVDAVLQTYNDPLSLLMKNESQKMADDVCRVLSGEHLLAAAVDERKHFQMEREEIRQSLQADSGRQESFLLSTQTIDYLNKAIDKTGRRFSGSLSPTLRASILSSGSKNEASPHTNKIKGGISIEPTTDELLALVPEPLRIKKRSQDACSPTAPAATANITADISGVSIFGSPSLPLGGQIKRTSSTRSNRRSTVSALPMDVVRDALSSYQSNMPRYTGSGDFSSLGTSTIMSQIERAPVVDTRGNTLSNPPSAPPKRMISSASSLAPPSTSSSQGTFDSQGHSHPLPLPISSPSTKRRRHIAQAEAHLTENTTSTPSPEPRRAIGSTSGLPPPQLLELPATAYVPNAAASRAKANPPRKTFAEHAADRPSMAWLQPSPSRRTSSATRKGRHQPAQAQTQQQPGPRSPQTSSVYSPAPLRALATRQAKPRPPPTSSIYTSPPSRTPTPEQTEMHETRKIGSMMKDLRASTLSPDRSYAPSVRDSVTYTPSKQWSRISSTCVPSTPTRPARPPPTDAELAARKMNAMTPTPTLRAPSTVSLCASRTSHVPSLTPSASSEWTRPSSHASTRTNYNDTRHLSTSTDTSKTSLGPWDMIHEAGGLPFRNSYAPDPANDVLCDLIRTTRGKLASRGSADTETGGENASGGQQGRTVGPWDAVYAAGGLPFRHSYGSIRRVAREGEEESIVRMEGGEWDEESVVGG